MVLIECGKYNNIIMEAWLCTVILNICCSRKHQYIQHGVFFGLNPPPLPPNTISYLWKIQLYIGLYKTTLPPQKFRNDPPWGCVWIFCGTTHYEIYYLVFWGSSSMTKHIIVKLKKKNVKLYKWPCWSQGFVKKNNRKIASI